MERQNPRGLVIGGKLIPEPKPTSGGTLKKKQSITHEMFLESWNNATKIVSKAELDNLIDATVEEIKARCNGKRACIAWSGGKDSLVLAHVAGLAGVTHAMWGRCNLEYPEFERWIKANGPQGLVEENMGQDLLWLKKNINMLFPKPSTKEHFAWPKIVHQDAQTRYFAKAKLDIMLLGRRHNDGNYCGEDGTGIYTTQRGTVRYQPIRYWRHEHVFACIQYYKIALPPIYGWLRGFRLGTSTWAGRKGTTSIEQGWSEIWTIDPDIVRTAAPVIQSAADHMAKFGLK